MDTMERDPLLHRPVGEIHPHKMYRLTQENLAARLGEFNPHLQRHPSLQAVAASPIRRLSKETPP